jgi:hypothetical protein
MKVASPEETQYYEEGKRRYSVILPLWWRPDALAINFDVNELDLN